MRLIIEKLQQVDHLINLEITGNLTDFAAKLNMSSRQMEEILDIMKAFGAPITFDSQLNSYVYNSPGEFQIGFHKY